MAQLEDKLEQDIKSALLGGDSLRVSTLRGLKATLLNLKVATGKRDTGLSDEEVLEVYKKEAKKRQESSELYLQGGNKEKAETELKEKEIIEAYLPAQLSEDEIKLIIDEVLKSVPDAKISDMGKIIGQVKAKTGAQADGSVIAKLVKEKLL